MKKHAGEGDPGSGYNPFSWAGQLATKAVQFGGGQLLSPSLIKDQINSTMKSEADGQEGYELGRKIVNGDMSGANTVSGAIGGAIADEMPNSPKLDTIPKLFLGFQRGGLQGGMNQIGSLVSQGVQQLGNFFKTSAARKLGQRLGEKAAEIQLPPAAATQLGEAFKGSPAAQGAANELAPLANNTFDHVLQNSVFGKGLKMITSPFTYMQDKAKELGLEPTDAGDAGEAT